jgi:ribose-phosphate pyrophosphokinase
MPGAEAAIMDPAIERIVVTDAIASFRLSAEAARSKVDVLAVAPLFAECIRRLHGGDTLTDLLVF